jgi:hypothetical protein
VSKAVATIHSCLISLAIATGVVGVGQASALPGPVLDARYDLQQVGAGELTWLGMPIYAASLWTDTGRYEQPGDTGPIALSLWYQRSFSRDSLIAITESAWKKLGSPAEAERDRWADELRRVWSDVEPGHNLTAVVLAGAETRFYDHRRFLGRIADPAFGPAFLSIWLDPRSVVSDLRAELLGLDVPQRAL